jgi:PKD repeat protein
VDNSAAEVKETVQTAEKVAAKVPAAADSATAVSPKTGIRQEAEEKPKEEVKIVEYSRYQDGFRTVVPKTSYTKRNAPVREKVNIKPVVIEDSSATRQIINNALPGKDNLKGTKGGNEPVAGASATEGCPPLEINFRNQSGTEGSSKWTFGDKGTSEERNPAFTFTDEGEHIVSFEQHSADGIILSSSISVLVYPKPEASFEHSPEDNLLAGNEVRFRNMSVNAVSYHWDFGDGSTSLEFEPVHKYRKAGDYNIQLIVTSDYGCADTLSMSRKVLRKR